MSSMALVVCSSVTSWLMPSRYSARPCGSRMGILRVCRIRSSPSAVRTTSAGMSMSSPRSRIARSPETRSSACSGGNRSKSLRPSISSRGCPRSSSPARLIRTKRNSSASLTKIIVGMFSMTESRNACDRRNSWSTVARRRNAFSRRTRDPSTATPSITVTPMMALWKPIQPLGVPLLGISATNAQPRSWIGA